MSKFHVEYLLRDRSDYPVTEEIEADGYRSGDGMIHFYNLEPMIDSRGCEVVPTEGSKGFPNVHTSLVLEGVRKVRKI